MRYKFATRRIIVRNMCRHSGLTPGTPAFTIRTFAFSLGDYQLRDNLYLHSYVYTYMYVCIYFLYMYVYSVTLRDWNIHTCMYINPSLPQTIWYIKNGNRFLFHYSLLMKWNYNFYCYIFHSAQSFKRTKNYVITLFHVSCGLFF